MQFFGVVVFQEVDFDLKALANFLDFCGIRYDMVSTPFYRSALYMPWPCVCEVVINGLILYPRGTGTLVTLI